MKKERPSSCDSDPLCIFSPQRRGRQLSTLPCVGDMVQAMDKETKIPPGETKAEAKVSRTMENYVEKCEKNPRETEQDRDQRVHDHI